MILTPKDLLQSICEILEIDEVIVRTKKRGVYSDTRFLFYYIGFNDFKFSKSALGEEAGLDWSCAINGINKLILRIANDDMVIISKIQKIRFELGVSDESTDTIMEQKYDLLLSEFFVMKKENQKLKDKIEKNNSIIKQLTNQCLQRP